MAGLGTLVNAAAIVLGSGIRWAIGRRIPTWVSEIVLQVLGLQTAVLGIQMALTATTAAQSVTVLIALVLGAALGEAIDIETALERLGGWLERRASYCPITKAFVTTSILYVVGPMAIIGSLQDGLRGDPSLLLVKSALDGIASIAFTASLGIAFSIVPVLLYQGLLTILASQLGNLEDEVAALTTTGGILVLGVGVNLLNLTWVRVGNFLPALALVILIVRLFPVWQLRFWRPKEKLCSTISVQPFLWIQSLWTLFWEIR